MDGNPIAVIADILNVDNAKTLIRPNAASGGLMLADNPTERQLVVQVRLYCFRTDEVMVFKNQRLKIGSPVVIQTRSYDLAGQIVSLDREAGDTSSGRVWKGARWLAVVLACENVDPEVAEAVRAGDVQKDTAGNVVAEVLRVTAQPAKRQFEVVMPETAKMILTERSDQQDVMLTLRLLTVTGNEGPIFRGQTVKLGRSLTFQNIRYDMGGHVTAIEDDVSGPAPSVE